MKLGAKFFLSTIAIVVVFGLALETASFFIFSKEIHSLDMDIFGEQVDHLVLLASEQDELFFEGLYDDEQIGQMRVIDKIRIGYRKQKNPAVFPFVVDGRGRIVIHPQTEQGRQVFSSDMVKTMEEKKHGEITYSENGVHYWCVFKVYEPWNWFFCMTMPIEYKNKTIVSFARIASGVTFLFIVLSGLVVLFISKKYIAPINLVIRRVQAIAKGETDFVNQTNSIVTSKDEVGVLSRAVDKMAADLQKMTVSRDELVKEIDQRKKVKEALAGANKSLRMNEKALKNILYDLKNANDELQQAQHRLLQSEKMAAVGQLSAGVAHEIKNPLAVILLSVESLEAAAGKDEKQQKYLKMIREATERANRVVVDLLSFSRDSNLVLKPHTVAGLLDGAVALMRHNAKLKNIEFKTDYPAQQLMVSVDGVLIQQVFCNVIGNAIDAIPDRGIITARAFARKPPGGTHQEAVIEISDTGGGMPPEVAAKIFEPFFTTKEQGKGTGLGLSTSFMIVEKHRGKIECRSRLGEGTTFTITLPLMS